VKKPDRGANRRVTWVQVLDPPDSPPAPPARPPAGRAGGDRDDLELTVTGSLADVAAEEWDALIDPNDPFLEHRFLTALERSGSVGGDSGWQPVYLCARQSAGGTLVGAVPLYLKRHSYGEFVFDWGWASSSHRAGIPYYPKLVAAAPFTPVTGRRLLVRPGHDAGPIEDALCEGLFAAADKLRASSIHVLFCTRAEQERLAKHAFAARLGLQFHWENRSGTPYRDFDDFLSAFRSRNRKQVRHERAIAASHGLRFETRTGTELGPREWAALEAFYESNIDKHDGSRYLTPAFFVEMRQHLGDRVVATLAYDGDRPVAGTLNFERGQHLYGRYWGALREHPMLHFEMCYYQLIDRAIARGYTRFEAGAQGEHKLKRGLDPAPTYSAHWIRHPGLGAAVKRAVESEAAAVEEELARYRELSPYARTKAPD
jgi:predicted N-acyltransferase